MDPQGNIYQPKPGQKIPSTHTVLTEAEASELLKLQPTERPARLVALRDPHNQRRRKAAKIEARIAKIEARIARRTPQAHCDAVNKDGHHCRLQPHSGKTNHRAFGKEWK